MNNRFLIISLALALQPLLARAQQDKPQYMIETIILSCPTGQVRTMADQVQTAVGEGKFDKSSLPKEVVLVSTPVVQTLENQAAEVRVGSPDPVQYFEKQSDGSFKLRHMPDTERVGVQIRYKVTSQTGNSDEVFVDAGLTVNWIQSREKITDVTLDVGKPVIVHSSTSAPSSMKLGRWCLLSAPSYSEGLDRPMLVLFRVRRGDPYGRFLDK